MYTGKEQVGTNRVELVDKHSFTSLASTDAFWQRIDTYCADHFIGTPKITIIGDGASWIKKGLAYLPNSRFVLYLFHLNKYIRLICGMNDYAKAIHYIKEDDYDGFKTFAYSYVHAKPDKEKAIRVAIRYIRNHWAATRTILLDATLHSSTEAHVSHILSSRLSSRPMGWSEKGAENIAKLRVLHNATRI